MGAFLALVLSFFIPGLGQFYNGQALKGVLLLFGVVILGIISGGILGFLIWLFGMFDAYSVANKPKAMFQSPIVTQKVTQTIKMEDLGKESGETSKEEDKSFDKCPKCAGKLSELSYYKIKSGESAECEFCGERLSG